MKISIITHSFNQGKFIEKNIKSILDQNYPNFEHIIVECGSTDDTVEILKKYSHLKWVTEADEGQADALNKGLKMATGEFIGWLNSDDYYLPNAFNIVSETYLNGKWDWLIVNLKYYYKLKNEFIEVINPDLTYDKLIAISNIVKKDVKFRSQFDSEVVYNGINFNIIEMKEDFIPKQKIIILQMSNIIVNTIVFLLLVDFIGIYSIIVSNVSAITSSFLFQFFIKINI